jgi:small-conductance mechanosensitive channel
MNAWPRLAYLALLLWMLLPAVGHAEEADATDKETAAWSASAEARLKQLDAEQRAWQQQSPEQKTMVNLLQEIETIRDRADNCVAGFSARQTSVQEKLKALGAPEDGASSEIRNTYKELQSQQQTVDGQLALCRVLSLTARDLKDAASLQQRAIISQQLLARERNIWQVFSDVVVNGFSADSVRRLSFEPWPALGAGILLLALLIPLALVFARVLRERFPAPPEGEMTAPLRRTVLIDRYSKRRAPFMAVLLAMGVVLLIGGAAPLAGIAASLLISAAVAPLVQLFVCQGKLRCPQGMPARLLMDLGLVAGALMWFDLRHYLPEEAYLLLRALFMFVLVLVSLWLLHRLSRREDLELLHNLRLPIAIALLAGPAAHWLGYVNLGEVLTKGIFGSAAGLLLTWLLLSMIAPFFQALGDVDNEAQSGLRHWLGYKSGDRVPGLSVTRWLIRIATVVALGYWLLFSWQVSPSSKAAIHDLVYDGFAIGEVTIVPAKLVLALLAFLMLLTLARWLQRQLGERWLTKTRLDSGARQSIVSLTSYTIIGVAIMLALSMAGLKFQNLAIVAGALSVGIGFGLQNIVNNFVSGLILLFERPVRPGDWVVVGGTEGYVRKISIRYTLIQTFDRADVLVPNSELISNQVTNLMLSDSFGRVTVPVGVAYGTDTRKVRELLNKVAREHPMAVLHDARVSAPRVFFMGFGDSSLDFELRFFIQDVDYKLSVRSDILFAIDDAFREAGIEIPFPQRVVHMEAQETKVRSESDTKGLPGE